MKSLSHLRRTFKILQIISFQNTLKSACFLLVLLCLISSCGSHEDKIQISAMDHFHRGNKFFKENRLQRAAEEYKLAIAQDPEQERFHYNLGLVYYSLVLYDKAIKQYWRAIEINPGFSEVWYNLALALEKTDETEKAVMAYQKYQKLNQQEKQEKTEKPKPKVVSKPGDK
ncbi:MAG: tetratricopeptide repeat protein [Proteobacteria bacterium]|nr:tetratricopeptide repeat protein [Pseudomonadota bacterium]